MKGKSEGFEFEGDIGGDGRIGVPGEILERLAHYAGSRLRVRLMPAVIAEALERRNVTAEEVERIASVQLESREQVISFLLSEGVLSTGAAGAGRRKGRRK